MRPICGETRLNLPTMANELRDEQVINVIQHVEVELAASRRENRIISRQDLTDYAATRMGLQAKQVAYVVDHYCETNAPGIPGFLNRQVESPVLKVAALINLTLGVIGCIVGLVLANKGMLSWPGFAVGGVFLLFGVVAYVKSLGQ